MADELPGLDAFGESLVAAARREDKEGQSLFGFAELPGLDRFGRELVASTRRRDRRRARARRFGIALGIALPIAATSGAATAVVLREAVIPAPARAHLADEQTPLAGTAVVSTVRAADPGAGLPWTVRVRTQCMTAVKPRKITASVGTGPMVLTPKSEKAKFSA